MLHEVLLSLWGCSTNALKILESDTVDLEKYLHPGERVLLKEILDIVEQCNIIRNFIQEYTTSDNLKSTQDLQNISQGLYLQALCEGMDQALEPFRKEIVNLEDIVLRDSYTPLSLILCRIQKYICLFSVLNSIIREIRTQKNSWL